MKQVNLDKYNNDWYFSGTPVKKFFWYFTNIFIFKTMIPIPSFIKCKVLRLFGANIGINVVIKPNVSIKYPWFLQIGDFSWIGENVWIDNLAQVEIGKNCVLSQGSFLLTGSHDYTIESFDLIVKKIVIQDGSWIGAKATVCPGVTLKSHSVLSVGSVATKDLESFGIYQGNPAIRKRERTIK